MSRERENAELPGATSVTDAQTERALAIVSAVPDPEIPAVTIADLGILRAVDLRNGGIVVTLTPTYSGCPATLAIQLSVEMALLDAGICDATVKTVLSPAWSTDDITEQGRAKLTAIGIAPPARKAGKRALFSEDTVACPRCGSMKTSRISEFGATACKALWRCEACREPFDYFKCI